MSGDPLTTTHLTTELLGGLGELVIEQPEGTYSLTPASSVGVRAIAQYADLLRGLGMDWGCGSGCLTLAAARVPAVDRVIGLDISAANIEAARNNALRNGLADRVDFVHADSYSALKDEGQKVLARVCGSVDFIVANPPASPGGDGFEFRRMVLRGGRDYLRPGGIVLLNISVQYADARIRGLCDDVPGYGFGGLVVSTDWVPFDMSRSDLSRQVVEYAEEEERGGVAYHFRDPRYEDERIVDARTALDIYRQTGLSPLSKWQNYLYRLEGQDR